MNTLDSQICGHDVARLAGPLGRPFIGRITCDAKHVMALATVSGVVRKVVMGGDVAKHLANGWKLTH